MTVFRRVRRGFTLRAALVCAATLSGQRASAQEPPSIRVGVDRVNVGVVVTDSSGRFVTGLRREDFRVFDNGSEQPVSGFLSNEDPAQVLLLVESGPAVLFLGTTNILAADRLLASLAVDDRVALASYS